jgi:myosin heavy subunit
MQFSRQRSLALAIACLCLTQEVLATRSHLRATHVVAHDHNKHAVATGQMVAKDRQMVEDAILRTNPNALHHLTKHMMQKAQDLDAEEIVAKLGAKLPPQVASLVHAASKKSMKGPQFTEESLAKARVILNGMIEEAQKSLDLKMVECTQFQNRNRGNLDMVNTDRSRLNSQLAELERLISEANRGQKDMAFEMEKLGEKRAAEEKAYNDQNDLDTAEMTSRKNDLAVAQFILMFTVCEDKKFLFLQGNTTPPGVQPTSNIGVLRCETPPGRKARIQI